MAFHPMFRKPSVVTGQVDVRGIEVPEVAEDGLLPLEEDDAATDEMMDSAEDMDENDWQNPKEQP
jgi:type I restriction enzyme S subunit